MKGTCSLSRVERSSRQDGEIKQEREDHSYPVECNEGHSGSVESRAWVSLGRNKASEREALTFLFAFFGVYLTMRLDDGGGNRREERRDEWGRAVRGKEKTLN